MVTLHFKSRYNDALNKDIVSNFVKLLKNRIELKMAHFKTQAQIVKSISDNLEKLEAGELSLSELEAHVQLIRELYERTIVLRYKAFESEVGSTSEPKKEAVIVETPTMKSPFIEIVAEDEFVEEAEEDTPSIDFSLFDTDKEEETQFIQPEVHSEIQPKVTETVTIGEQPEVQIEEKETPVVEPVLSSGTNSSEFMQKFSVVAKEANGQFGFSKLDTLVGSFGLNERLQYINELFDGSSETFSDAIKALDSLNSIDDAKQKTAQFAASNNWDLESDTVVEFIQKLCRRYV